MKKWFIYGICLLSLLNSSMNVLAEDSSSQLAGGYTIEGIPSERQLDKNASYFYLKELPGETDQVKIKLTNDSEKEKTLEVKITNANTNSNGLIDYTGQVKDHPSLKNPLSSIARPSQKEVNVPAKSSVDTTIMIKMPKQTLPGIIAGGIVVSEKQEKEKEKKELSLRNIYTYTLGLVLTNESQVEPMKNVSVLLDKIGAVLFDGRKIIQADILNPNPYVFSNATVKGEIFGGNNSKPIKSQEKTNVSIAPYSVYPFQFDWKKESLKPGKYLFKGSVSAKEKTWEFEKAFEITAEKAKKINKESVFKIYLPNWLTYSYYVLGLLSILGTIYLVYRRKNK